MSIVADMSQRLLKIAITSGVAAALLYVVIALLHANKEAMCGLELLLSH